MCCCPLVVLDFTLQLNIAFVSNIIMYFLLCPYGVNVNRLTTATKKKINKQKAVFSQFTLFTNLLHICHRSSSQILLLFFPPTSTSLFTVLLYCSVLIQFCFLGFSI